MSTRSSACPVLLLLVVAHAMVVSAAVPATTTITAEAPRSYHYDDYDLFSQKYEDTLLSPAAAGEAVPTTRAAVAGCVKTVLHTSRPCVRDALLTLVFGKLHLSQGCCNVLASAGEKCVADVFSCVPGELGAALLPVVNRVCGFVATIV